MREGRGLEPGVGLEEGREGAAAGREGDTDGREGTVSFCGELKGVAGRPTGVREGVGTDRNVDWGAMRVGAGAGRLNVGFNGLGRDGACEEKLPECPETLGTVSRCDGVVVRGAL